MNGFAVTLGAIASALAIAAAVRSGWLRRLDRLCKNELRMHLGRLRRIDRWMTNVLLELDQILSKGTGWWGELPEDVKPMSGHMRFCIGLTLELEYKVADIRSLDAHGPTERLRSDLERLVVVMRQALEIYQTDIWKRYLAVKGEQIEYASDAREPTVTLETQHIPLLQELRREAEMLFLTSIYRLGASKIFASYEVNWPIDRRPGANLDIGPLWGGDVRPLLD